jgi:hypothetical protein
MDPVTAVGLVASVAQLADMVRAIVGNMYQYFEAVKDAPLHSKELRAEMATLCNILDSLDDGVSKIRVKVTQNLLDALGGLKLLLKELEPRVSKSETKSLKRWRWPFTQSENERLLSRITRYKETLNLALVIETW